MGNKIWTWVTLITAIICLIVYLVLFRMLYFHALPYKACVVDYNVEINTTRPSDVNQSLVEKEISQLFNNRYYNIRYSDDLKSCGQSNLFTSQITIRTNLPLETFVFTLAHELVHISYFTVNERFCNFTAWKLLYESGNDYFKNIALSFMFDSNYPSMDYYFEAYAVEYLCEQI